MHANMLSELCTTVCMVHKSGGGAGHACILVNETQKHTRVPRPVRRAPAPSTRPHLVHEAEDGVEQVGQRGQQRRDVLHLLQEVPQRHHGVHAHGQLRVAQAGRNLGGGRKGRKGRECSFNQSTLLQPLSSRKVPGEVRRGSTTASTHMRQLRVAQAGGSLGGGIVVEQEMR